MTANKTCATSIPSGKLFIPSSEQNGQTKFRRINTPGSLRSIRCGARRRPGAWRCSRVWQCHSARQCYGARIFCKSGSVNSFSRNGMDVLKRTGTTGRCSGAWESGCSSSRTCLGWSLATKHSRPRSVAVVYRTADVSGFWADETLGTSRAAPISWVVRDVTRNIGLIIGAQVPRRISTLYHTNSENLK